MGKRGNIMRPKTRGEDINDHIGAAISWLNAPAVQDNSFATDMAKTHALIAIAECLAEMLKNNDHR